MPTRSTELYDDVLEAMPIDPDGILAFRLPPKLQQRVSRLAARNNAGKLTADEQLELQKFLALEATVRALKAKALMAQSGTRRRAGSFANRSVGRFRCALDSCASTANFPNILDLPILK